MPRRLLPHTILTTLTCPAFPTPHPMSFFSGQETSAILLGWTAALLAHNPKVQAAAAAEVAAVLGTSSSSGGVPLGPGVLPQLPYVTAVVLEALRLWSPAYMVGRCANRDVDLAGGYVLPAGTTCLVSPYLLHRWGLRSGGVGWGD